MLSLIIGLATQGIKAATPKETWVRAILPAIPIFIGAICGLIPGVLIGEAKLLLGAGAGALSSSAVELWNRYKDQATIDDLKRVAFTPVVKPPLKAEEKKESEDGKL
jgi:hypothetical protein